MTDQNTENHWPDIAGKIEGDTHILPIRVYFEDTDFSGLVYHTSYLRWCERGRSDFVRLLGLHHNALLNPQDGSEPCVFVVRHLEIDYLQPAKIDDILEVNTRCSEIGKATLEIVQTIMREGRILIKARVKVVLISTNGRPLRIGALIRDAFAKLQTA